MPQRIQTGNADGVGATPLNILMKPKKKSLRGDGVGATPKRITGRRKERDVLGLRARLLRDREELEQTVGS